MKRCFAPCFSLSQINGINLDVASIIISLYTIVLHFLATVYFIYILNGGRNDIFYSPIFEFDKGMKTIAIVFLIYCLLYIGFAILLIIGIKKVTNFNSFNSSELQQSVYLFPILVFLFRKFDFYTFSGYTQRP